MPISVHQRPSSVAIRGHRWQSVAIKGHQRSSEALTESLRPSLVIKGHQRHSPSRYAPLSSSKVIRGTHRVVSPLSRWICQEGSTLTMHELDACKLKLPRAQPRGKFVAARHVVRRESANAARLRTEAIRGN